MNVADERTAPLEALVARSRARRRNRERLGWRLTVPLTVLAITVLITIFGPWLAPFDPTANVGAELAAPSGAHWFGTDELGRDIFSRVLFGMRTTWWSALVVIASGVLIGGMVGLVAGAVGGRTDWLLMRMTDLFLALPGAILAIAVVATMGPSLSHTLIAVSIVWWPLYARVMRGEVRALMARPHIEAARMAGAGRLRLWFRHLVPGTVTAMLVTASLDVGVMILMLAALSFLGLGQLAPAPELGSMSAAGLPYLLGQWWVSIMPGLAVFVLALVANVGGDGLRDLLDRPRR